MVGLVDVGSTCNHCARQVVNTPSRNQLVVDSYRKLGDGRKAVAFCCDIPHANALADTFTWVTSAAAAAAAAGTIIECQNCQNRAGQVLHDSAQGPPARRPPQSCAEPVVYNIQYRGCYLV